MFSTIRHSRVYRTIILPITPLTEGAFIRRHAGGGGAAPAPKPRKFRSRPRVTVRPNYVGPPVKRLDEGRTNGGESLRDQGERNTPVRPRKNGPGAKNRRGEATRGAPACVMGRRPGRFRDRPDRKAGHGVRTSAARRFTPSGIPRGRVAGSRRPKTAADETCPKRSSRRRSETMLLHSALDLGDDDAVAGSPAECGRQPHVFVMADAHLVGRQRHLVQVTETGNSSVSLGSICAILHVRRRGSRRRAFASARRRA